MRTTNHRDGVLLVEFDRGKVNALDLELLRAIIDSFTSAPSDHPVVLTGACGLVDELVPAGDLVTRPFDDANKVALPPGVFTFTDGVRSTIARYMDELGRR
jgi:hypothetical protein